MTRDEAKRIIEAFLFASDSPVRINEMASVLEEIDSATIRDLVYELKGEYESQKRSFTIIEVAGGVQIVADAYYAPWIKKLLGKERVQRLSMPSLETLAIIAYKQPITRSEIEMIRGVNVDGIIESLLEKNLIKTSGRKEAPGRPFVYSTTDEFLVHFGLRSLDDLPKLKEFSEADIQTGNKDLVIENISRDKKEEIDEGTGEPTKAD
ncbi:MAG: SMC-Scp complex subunit ScpB [Candidatus Omnitrophica bacterium]|nr:SMC-Scp complex subunit ScpB [Candidatus Omnitrophota bacterium]